MSPQVAASIQALLNEETILRTKMENELRELNSELSAFQALRNNGKYLFTRKTKCKLTPKGIAAQLPPLWCKHILTFLLNQLEANISPVIDIKYFYLL